MDCLPSEFRGRLFEMIVMAKVGNFLVAEVDFRA